MNRTYRWLTRADPHGWPDEIRHEFREFSLLERLNHLISGADPYRLAQLKKLLRTQADVYEIVHAGDLFKAVLHLPKPMAEILDDFDIPRSYPITIHNYTFGPAPEFVGPRELVIEPKLVQLVPGVIPPNKLFVQPLSGPVPGLSFTLRMSLDRIK